MRKLAHHRYRARQDRRARARDEFPVRAVGNYGSLEQWLVLANMEAMNAEFIHTGLTQGERLKRLNQIPIRQIQVLTSANSKALAGAKEK